MVRGECFTAFNFKVFDRWGEKVFETVNSNTGWDGTFNGENLLDNGVYFWSLKATKNGEEINRKGYTTLLR